MNPFDLMYEGTPPWDTGRPQPAVVQLAERGVFHGDVLDVGCGTGENALFLARQGARVLGVDLAQKAIALAAAKAEQQGSTARFQVHDALDLPSLGRQFDAVLDCGMFHTLDDAGRARYRASLAGVMRPGAALVVLCFSDKEPPWGGPRRVSREELRATFGPPFALERVTPVTFQTNFSPTGALAYCAEITHVGRVVSRGN